MIYLLTSVISALQTMHALPLYTTLIPRMRSKYPISLPMRLPYDPVRSCAIPLARCLLCRTFCCSKRGRRRATLRVPGSGFWVLGCGVQFWCMLSLVVRVCVREGRGAWGAFPHFQPKTLQTLLATLKLPLAGSQNVAPVTEPCASHPQLGDVLGADALKVEGLLIQHGAKEARCHCPLITPNSIVP